MFQIAFLIAVLALIFFGARVALFTLYWSDPDNRVRPLESWMTLGFVAKLHNVPRADVIDGVAKQFSVDIGPQDRVTIRQLARRNGLQIDELLDDIEEIVEDLADQPDDRQEYDQ